jgi:asparagine synthase (glutamine-hydrolysing)
MSRIAGIMSEEGGQRIDAMASALSVGTAGSQPVVRKLTGRANARLVASAHHGPALAFSEGGVSVVLDGHIYNRDALGDAPDDAALFATLYRRRGFADALSQINGDFAVALHDEAADRLWLGRDRLGVKPLYYAMAPGFFAFASRPRALTCLLAVGAEINTRFAAIFAGAHYRYFDNQPDESPYRRVAQLPAAHWLCLRRGSVETGRYWALDDAPDWNASQEELAAQYRDLLLNAVDLRVRSAVRPAFTLSGGMDSSSVLASAVNRTGRRQDAYSTVYADKTFDESDEIRTMLEANVSTWRRVAVDKPDVFSLVRRMVRANDEPVATATWLSHFLLCEQAAAEGFGSLFGGLGGDELNAGEYEYFFFFFADLKRAGAIDAYRREVGHWARHHDHPIHRKDIDVAEATIFRVTDPRRPGTCRPDDRRLRRYYDAVDPGFLDMASFEPVLEHTFSSYLKNRTWQDLSRETAPCCLRAEDRHTQAFGLDNFLPFFDHRLVEFMFRVPGAMKICDGVTKILLREAMRGILPEETRIRIKKTGWNAPAHLWFSGEGLTRLLDLIHSRSFRERGIYRVDAVERLATDHAEILASGAQRENHMMFFWQLLNLEMWFQDIASPAALQA